jgi:hypothetical protein
LVRHEAWVIAVRRRDPGVWVKAVFVRIAVSPKYNALGVPAVSVVLGVPTAAGRLGVTAGLGVAAGLSGALGPGVMVVVDGRLPVVRTAGGLGVPAMVASAEIAARCLRLRVTPLV